jgi:long-chain acyl-CoA synthetase
MSTAAPYARTTDVEMIQVGGLWVHRSLPALFQQQVQEQPHAVQNLRRLGGEWRGVSAAQVQRHLTRLALGLLELGVERGDRVGIVSQTRMEWGLADMAILHVGGVVVGVYPTLTAEEVGYQLQHSGCEVVFVEDAGQLAKLREVQGELPALRRIVLIDPAGTTADERGEQVLTLDEVLALGAKLPQPEARLERSWREIGPDDLATLIYTSGTTGPPKGVMLSHRSLVFTATAAAEAFPHRPDDASVVFLPMAHVLQRWAAYLGLITRATAYYAESHHTLMDDIRDVHPTIQVSVPRIWEKVHARIQERLAAAPPHRQRMFAWALGIGKQAAPYLQAGQRLPLRLRWRHALAKRVVFDPLKEKVFGRRIRYLTSGGAPISLELLEFFHALGILILEGWGLSETAAPVCVNMPDAFRFGTVGKALPGTEVKIAADGEILVRGPGVFQGYYRDPEGTAEAFDDEGYFHTGDIGVIDPDGYVRITDRKKNLIVMANGKNIAPQNLENHFKSISLIDNCVVVGDRRPYLIALFVIDPEEALAWARAKGLMPAASGPEDETARAERVPELVALPALRAELERAIQAKNAELARYEQLKRWEILPETWSIAGGELTPTLKTKRRVLLDRHAERIEAVYAAPREG